jgi:hypothetical protein
LTKPPVFKYYLTTLSPQRSSVNFINVLQAAFMHTDPKSVKKDIQVVSFFTLLGSALVKAARRKLLMKLTPDAK